MAIRRKEKGKDPYTQFHGQALALIQQMAGKRWTDYNAHDPGVTLLDTFCYGLLDIEYRLGFDFTSFMPHDTHGNIDYRAWGLWAEATLFADALVTSDDYARMVKTQVAGVSDCRVEWTETGYRFLVVLGAHAKAGEIQQDIRDLYYRNRNLGERLLEVKVVRGPLEGNGTPHAKPDIAFANEAQPDKATIPLQGYRYQSLQYEMPACYGLGREGIPADADRHHQAYIFQLKGYMLLVDYLFSGIDQQLQAIPQLMGRSTYHLPQFAADVDIEGIETLLDRTKLGKTPVFDRKRMQAKRLSFAEMCCVMYGEEVSDIKSLLQVNFADSELAERFVSIVDRLPEWQRHRARGMDITDGSGQDMPTLKRFLGAVLGSDVPRECLIAERLKGIGVDVVEDEVFFRRYPKHPIGVDPPRVGQMFKVPAISMKETSDTPNRLEKGVPIIGMGLLPESLLVRGADLGNYRIARHQGTFTLYCIATHGERWLKLAHSAKGNQVIEYANLLSDYLKTVRLQAYTFYLVEHVLLAQADPVSDNQRMTIILPTAWKSVYGQYTLETWLRKRLPASMEYVFKWYSLQELSAFENVYFKWKQAYSTRNRNELVRQSNALGKWL